VTNHKLAAKKKKKKMKMGLKFSKHVM